jgi:hypothetical protein
MNDLDLAGNEDIQKLGITLANIQPCKYGLDLTNSILGNLPIERRFLDIRRAEFFPTTADRGGWLAPPLVEGTHTTRASHP